jgi:hypothetical protein
MKNTEQKHTRRDFLVGGGQTIAGLSVMSTAIPLAACQSSTPSQSQTPPPSKPSFPTTGSPVTRYDHDPSWPQKPETINFAGIPAIMADNEDRIWVSNRAYPAMQIYDTSGKFIRAWDSPDLFSETGPALFKNREEGPYNLHYFRFDDAGNVWIANTNRHIVQKCDTDGNVLMTIGTADEAGEDETHLSRPSDMTVTPVGVFISDGYGNRRVVHYSADGKFIKTWGQEGTGPEDFIDPHAICHVGDHLYVVDRGNIRIKVYDFEGNLLDIWRDLLIAWPLIPTANNEIWTCGCTPIKLENYGDITGGKLQQDQIVVKFNPEGKILQLYAFPTCARGTEHVPGKLNMLHAITEDTQGNLYLGEAFNPGPQKYVRSLELTAKVEGEYR